MILVVGLGNPGAKYAGTRHNAGFLVVDRLVGAAGGQWREKFSGRFAQIEVGGERVVALEPLTFMNESGRSVQPAMAFFKLTSESLLVVHDELDLDFGELRLKLGGGDAGHRGLKSITTQLGGPSYARLRVGIGRPRADFRGSQADYVLEGFAPEERAHLDGVLDRAVDAVRLVIERGLTAAMNVTNQKPRH